MKNNNNLIIENKVPIEIVQELKSEYHQTYEEFMRTYQEEVNYDDLDNGDISEVKGYGPCTSSNCTHSREELWRQLRELQSQLSVAISARNNTNIYIIQQNINTINVRLDNQTKNKKINENNLGVTFKIEEEGGSYYGFQIGHCRWKNWEENFGVYILRDPEWWNRCAYKYTYEIEVNTLQQLENLYSLCTDEPSASGISMYIKGSEFRNKVNTLLQDCRRGEVISGTYWF